MVAPLAGQDAARFNPNDVDFIQFEGEDGGASGVFALGDARSGNVKRVASAVGEGSISVQIVFKALSDL